MKQKMDKNTKFMVIGMSLFVSVLAVGTICLFCIDKFVPQTNNDKAMNQAKEEKRNEFLESQNPLPELTYTEEEEKEKPLINEENKKSLSDYLKDSNDGKTHEETTKILNNYIDEFELSNDIKQEASQTQAIGIINNLVESYLRDKKSVDKITMTDYINSSLYMIYDAELYVNTLFSLPQVFQSQQYKYNNSYVMECLKSNNNIDSYKLNEITEIEIDDTSHPLYSKVGFVPDNDKERTTHIYLVDFTYNEVSYYLSLYKTKENYMFTINLVTQDENTYSDLSTVEKIVDNYN